MRNRSVVGKLCVTASGQTPTDHLTPKSTDVRFVAIVDIPQFIQTRGRANHKTLLKMLMADSLLSIAPI
jgi:hypothetical protein